MSARGWARIQLIGNVGRDAELKYLPSGKAKATFRLAVNRREINQVVYFGLALEGGNTLLPASPLYSAEDRAAESDMSVLLGNSDERSDREDAYLELFREQRVNGVLVTPGHRGDAPSPLTRYRSNSIGASSCPPPAHRRGDVVAPRHGGTAALGVRARQAARRTVQPARIRRAAHRADDVVRGSGGAVRCGRDR